MGYALLPGSCFFIAMTLFFLCAQLAKVFGVGVVAIPMLLLALVMLSCFGWAAKEYYRPSKWRRAPVWIGERSTESTTRS